MSEKNRRRTVARHGQQRSPGPLGQLLKIIGIALAVVLVSGAGVAAFIVTDLGNTFVADAVELDGQETVPPDISGYEGGFNMLLAGVDTCEEQYRAYFGDRCNGPDSEGHLNDVNILLHVSDEPRRITAVSFPRDLMIPLPECPLPDGGFTSAASKQPLNSTFQDGGLNCIAKTITKLTGQDIDFAASVTFGGVIEITNDIGGVDVCLATPIRDEHTGLDMDAGTHTVSGIQALQFLRTRYGVGDGSDLGRIGNQQQYMTNLARKLISEDVLGNFPVMLRLANTALSNITPSTSLANNPMTIVQIAFAVKSVPFEDIVFVQYPTLTDPDNPNKVVPNYGAATTLWDAINANQRLEITHENTEDDGVVLQQPVEGDAEPAPSEPGTDAPVEPGEPTVALPPSIKGNSAAQPTCSNGNVRR